MKSIKREIRHTLRLTEEEEQKLTQIKNRRRQTVSEYFRERLRKDK